MMQGDLVHRLDYRTVSDMSVDEVRPLLQVLRQRVFISSFHAPAFASPLL
jgi:hypothetical protein